MSLYKDVKAAGGYIDNHESDLYIEANDANRELLKKHGITNAKMFRNQLTGKLCYDVPFAYEPWREAKQAKAAK